MISWVATTRGINDGLVGDLMMQAVDGIPIWCKQRCADETEWLLDNGSCYTAQETSNGAAECFVKTLKRDYASLALRPDARIVMQQLPEWFEHYNIKHPHSALQYM